MSILIIITFTILFIITRLAYHNRLAVIYVIDKMLENEDMLETGMCQWSRDLYQTGIISRKEFRLFTEYLHDNDPNSSHGLYYYDPGAPGRYYYKSGDLEPRKLWLNEQLLKLNKLPFPLWLYGKIINMFKFK